MTVQLETLPLYSTTAKISKFFAYLIDDHWRCYIYLLMTVILNVLEIIFVVSSDIDLTHLVLNLFLSVLWLSTNMRVFILIINRKQVNAFLEEIHCMYMNMMNYGDEATMAMLKETTKSARRFGYFNLILGMFSCIGMFLSSFLAKQRELIFDIYLPFYDDRKLETPCFEIISAVQFILIPIGCCMFMTFINLVIALLLFTIFMCKVMQKELRGLGDGKSVEALDTKLIKCVHFHNTISYYVGKINYLTTYVFSLEFVLFGALMCVLLFLLIIVKTIYERIIMFAYIFMIFVQLTVIYFYANILYFESLGIADAAYDTNWYLYNGKIRMTLKLIIQRAQKPICLTMGNFHPMTLDALKTLLNFTYSYFTILRNMMN